MPDTYTCAYTCPACNVSTAALSAAWALLPRDVLTERLLGLTLVSDMMSTAGSVVSRTIVYSTVGGTPLLGNPETGDALTNFYTETFSQGLSSRVKALPVVYS